MIISLIKYFFIIVSCFILYTKILDIKNTKLHILIFLINSITISCLSYGVSLLTPYLRIFSMMFLFFLSALLVFKRNILTTFTSTVISFGASYICYVISAIITSPVSLIWAHWNIPKNLFNPITVPLIGIIQIFLSNIPFFFKRLRKGMPFLENFGNSIIGLVLCILIVIASTLLTVNSTDDLIFAVTIPSLFISGLLLVAWWRKQLTKTYIEKIRQRELESLHIEVENLKNENEKLSKIIHKDNKLIPSMIMTVKAALNTNSSDELKQLTTELEILTNERAGTLAAYENKNATISATGCFRLDAILQYLHNKMISNEINFVLANSVDMKHVVSTVIDENSLSTLIADLVENALIATRNQSDKYILLNFDYYNGNFNISISDSGVPFSPAVYRNLGINRYTTHKKDGGSGIGLMTSLELIKKHSSSFIIEELDNQTYSKKVIVTFDGLSQIRINSQRPEVCKLTPYRNDIIFTLNT